MNTARLVLFDLLFVIAAFGFVACAAEKQQAGPAEQANRGGGESEPAWSDAVRHRFVNELFAGAVPAISSRTTAFSIVS